MINYIVYSPNKVLFWSKYGLSVEVLLNTVFSSSKKMKDKYYVSIFPLDGLD